MKYVKVFLTLFIIAGIVFGISACKKSAEQAVEEEPLLLLDEVEPVEEEPLLLLDELDPNEACAESGPVADNSRCYVCHMNFDGEELSAIHAKNDVSCEDCHGASDKHCSDEDNITPPDKMFAKDAINSFCKSCHPDGKLAGGKKYCVECHGKHFMEHRTRRWNKKTGELLEDDKVRMLTDEMLKKE